MKELLILLGFVGLILVWRLIENNFNGLFNSNSNNSIKSEKVYSIKSLMTKYERYFYDILLELENELNIKVMPQVNLAAIINKEANNKYRNELFRNIDFGIFSKDYEKLLLLIEINDKTHNNRNRKYRDSKVDKIVNSAGIKLIKFYSNYPNKKDYIKKRVIEEISKI